MKDSILRYYHNNEMGIMGTLANIKKRFHHNHAGREAKVGTSKKRKIRIYLSLITFPQDYYATFDLVEVAWRMHLVKLALSFVESRGLPRTFSELEALAKDLSLEFNLFDKYKRSSISDCPNLSISDTVELLEAREAPPMLDIPETCNKKVKAGTQACTGLVLEVEEVSVQLSQVDRTQLKDLHTYEEYHKGLLYFMFRVASGVDNIDY